MDGGLTAAAGFRAALLALLCAACTSIAADQRTFAGTRWRATAINGHATPAANDRFFIEFRAANFTARMGCNTASGAYSVHHDVLRPGLTVMTQAACYTNPPGEIQPMSFEKWGFEVIGRPARMHWVSSRRLTLSNSAGSIALELMR